MLTIYIFTFIFLLVATSTTTVTKFDQFVRDAAARARFKNWANICVSARALFSARGWSEQQLTARSPNYFREMFYVEIYAHLLLTHSLLSPPPHTHMLRRCKRNYFKSNIKSNSARARALSSFGAIKIYTVVFSGVCVWFRPRLHIRCVYRFLF